MSKPINPYITDNPVGACAIGRSDILRNTIQILRQVRKNAIVLYGQRCIGKTSVLQYLKAQLPSEGDYYPVYFDLQDKATLALGSVINELAKSMAQALNQVEPDLGDHPEITFKETWLPLILQNLPKNAALILLFDEFDANEPKINQAGITFFPYVRQLLNSEFQNLNFVFAGGRNIDDLDKITISLFRDVPPTKHLSRFNQEETTELVRVAEANLNWPDETVESVWRYTHGHPFFTQQVCYQVWAQAYKYQSEKTPTATPADVENVIFDVLDASRYRMTWLWEGLPPAERIVASALAESASKTMTESALEKKLYDSGVHIVIRELQNAPRSLQDWGLLILTEEGYQFHVELIRRWIRENKPFRRIIAELDRIDPVADNIFQGAVALHKEVKLELSAKQLREVIALNPNHLGAHQLLADILLALGQVVEAKALLEQLYHYQPLIARSRLIQALLTLAPEKDDEARLELYEQVLALEPNQSEATAKSREIWQQRGEAALAKEDLKTALAVYKKLGVNKKIAEIEQKIRTHYFSLIKESDTFNKKGRDYPLWALVILMLAFGVWFYWSQQVEKTSSIRQFDSDKEKAVYLAENDEKNKGLERKLERAHGENASLEKRLEQTHQKNGQLERELERARMEKALLEKTLEEVTEKNALMEKALAQANQTVTHLKQDLVKISKKNDFGSLISQLEKGDQIIIVGSYLQLQDAERQLEKFKMKYPTLFDSQSVNSNLYQKDGIWEISISGSYSYQSAKALEKNLRELGLIEDTFIRRNPMVNNPISESQ